MQRQRSNEACLRKWRKTPETMSVWKTRRVVHWGSSRQPPGSPIHSDSLTQHIVAHTAMSYHSDRIQSKVNKEKVHGMKLGRRQEGAPKGLLPVESQRLYFIPPGTCSETLVKYCQPSKLVETQHLGFLLGAGHTGTLCLPCTNITHSQRETSLQHKPYCSHGICKWAAPTTSGKREHCSSI